jgi:hypothetical protein
MGASRSSIFALVWAACLWAAACSDVPAESGATSTSAGAGGSGGAEPLPPLDPAACIVAADSGADPEVADAAEEQWSPAYVAPKSGSIQQDKAFFFATLLSADDALMAEIAADATLGAISLDRDDRLRDAPADCADDVTCYGEKLLWSEADATAAGAALRDLLVSSGKLAALSADMRASGRFARYAAKSDEDLVEAALRDLVIALGATFGSESTSLGGPAIRAIVEAVAAAHPSALLFFEPLLLLDLAALKADMRDEAARYEPLEEGENAEALAHIPKIDWDAHPFTVILVPGKGPSEPDVALDAMGQARCDLAAQRFAAGIAPLIAVSGGHVHPDRTLYSEAIEMKKYLRDAHGIPEEVILVDPHARHTTTNLRNVSRLLYRYGAPTDRPLLVTSDFGQSLYIGYWKGMFGPRCEDELGYRPWRALVPLSVNDACLVPVAISLHADGRDPLDP